MNGSIRFQSTLPEKRTLPTYDSDSHHEVKAKFFTPKDETQQPKSKTKSVLARLGFMSDYERSVQIASLVGALLEHINAKKVEVLHHQLRDNNNFYGPDTLLFDGKKIRFTEKALFWRTLGAQINDEKAPHFPRYEIKSLETGARLLYFEDAGKVVYKHGFFKLKTFQPSIVSGTSELVQKIKALVDSTKDKSQLLINNSKTDVEKSIKSLKF